MFRRMLLALALTLGVFGVSQSPALAYWDCTDYDGYTACYWYEDPPPYTGPYWWECWNDHYECSPCSPCSA